MTLRMSLLAAGAAMCLATPAMARDGSPYVGIEGGIMLLRDGNYDYQGSDGSLDGPFTVDHKLGFDGDLIAGYDFGMVRTELELGFKRAGIKDVDLPANFGASLGDGGRARSVSAMGNVLLDFGDEEATSFFVGAGVGVARTSYRINALSLGGTDGNLAYQLIAGVRTAITPNLDAGLKYRLFRSKFNVEEGSGEEALGKWRSHSLLASLIYNFGGAVAVPPTVPPPPPVAPAPETQTCPDGSVILTTEVCPAPPAPEPAPPPPPPVTAGERGL